jgi:hypothetical protein
MNLPEARPGPRIDVWYGSEQRVGHLGTVQPDYNLVGHVEGSASIVSLTYRLNDGAWLPLSTGVYRRIVAEGDFNADIPVLALRPGPNQVLLRAEDARGHVAEETVTLRYEPGGPYPLPTTIHWAEVSRLDDVGLVTDGRWAIRGGGLHTEKMGYDRVFMLGDTTWQDYQVTGTVTIHGLTPHNGPQSGQVKHAGYCLRWQGHTLARNRPGDQPKWGLHPRGALTWVTVREGRLPPLREFYPGESDRYTSFTPYPISFGQPFWMKGRCETLPASTETVNVTRYSFKVWDLEAVEPPARDYQVVQESAGALRRGALALVAHETDVTFGDLEIVPSLPGSLALPDHHVLPVRHGLPC